jgi:hypothetical protein
MAIYDQKCKLSKRTNRQISLALLVYQIVQGIVHDIVRLYMAAKTSYLLSKT